eukprot:2414757-Amphidinium_carterae.2
MRGHNVQTSQVETSKSCAEGSCEAVRVLSSGTIFASSPYQLPCSNAPLQHQTLQHASMRCWHCASTIVVTEAGSTRWRLCNGHRAYLPSSQF